MALNIIETPDAPTARYTIDHAGTFDLPKIGESQRATLPAVMFRAAVQHLADTAEEIAKVEADATLSELGKARKLEPLRKELIKKIAGNDANVDVDERHWNAQEAELLAVPKVDPGNTVAAVEDREIRDWWRAQSQDDRSKIMQRMQAEPGNERLMIAMLRSPIPQLDHEVKFMRELWNQLARLNDPAKAFAIQDGRAGVELARRGIAIVAGISKRVTKLDERSIAETLLGDGSGGLDKKHGLFAVSFQTMETAKRIAEQRAKVKAA